MIYFQVHVFSFVMSIWLLSLSSEFFSPEIIFISSRILCCSFLDYYFSAEAYFSDEMFMHWKHILFYFTEDNSSSCHIPCLLVPTSVSFHDGTRLIFFASQNVFHFLGSLYWIILDGILDTINVKLWILWILSFPTDEECFLYFSRSFSWLGLNCRLLLVQ